MGNNSIHSTHNYLYYCYSAEFMEQQYNGKDTGLESALPRALNDLTMWDRTEIPVMQEWCEE